MRSEGQINLNTATLNQNGTSGSPAVDLEFYINNTGGGTISYTVSDDADWLPTMPSSGTVTAESDKVYAYFDASALSSGTYNATITVAAPEANNSPETIGVTFTVDGANMLVTSPSGGENLTSGTTQNITWSSSLGGNVKIELYNDDSLDHVLIDSTPNDGSYAWTVPSDTSGYYFKIKITSVETPAENDISDTVFIIDNFQITTANPLSDGTIGNSYSETIVANGGTTLMGGT